jgi:hypothetical protein
LFLNGKGGGSNFDFDYRLLPRVSKGRLKNKGRLENKDKSGRVYLYSKRPFKRFPA